MFLNIKKHTRKYKYTNISFFIIIDFYSEHPTIICLQTITIKNLKIHKTHIKLLKFEKIGHLKFTK